MRHRPLISQLANVRNGSKADTSRRSHCYDLSFLRVAPVSVSASIGLRNAPSRNTCKNTKRPTDNRTNSRCRCDKSPSDRQFVECERCSNGKGQPVGSVDCAVRDPPFSTDKLVSSSPGTEGFRQEYQACVEGLTAEPIVPGAERVRPGSFHDLIARYYRSPDFLDPGERTREVYRGVIERWRVKYGEALVRDLRSGCDEAGLSHCSAHGLRKAAARRFAEAECSNQQIKAWTGHVPTARFRGIRQPPIRRCFPTLLPSC